MHPAPRPNSNARPDPESPPHSSHPDAETLRRVIGLYDLGTLLTARPIRRGTPETLKILVETSHGRFVLKRRTTNQQNPAQVAMHHRVLLYLHDHGFPAPRPVGAAADRNSVVQMDGGVYELFEFLEGEPYDRSRDSTYDAGALHARLHTLLAAYRDECPAPHGLYHDSASVRVDLESAWQRLARQQRAAVMLKKFAQAYVRAGRDAHAKGIDDHPPLLIHGDWHPGNLRFRNGRVSAALDFEQIRRAPQACDLASACLHFALKPDLGLPPLDSGRLGLYAKGYRESGPPVQIPFEAFPGLMIEALVAEAIAPIARTGAFPGRELLPFMRQMLEVVVGIDAQRDSIVSVLNG